MNLNNPAYTLSLRQRIRLWLLAKLGGVSCEHLADEVVEASESSYALGHTAGHASGLHEGERRARVHFAVLPLPFTPDQLKGREYGDFITPIGYATQFGEYNIPAPGSHGYEQRAYYVDRQALDGRSSEVDLRCHGLAKFGHEPLSNPDTQLVPVIVTVLR